MVQTVIGGVVRAIVASVGGGLVASGLLQADDVTAVTGAVTTLVMIAWSVYQKYRTAAGQA